MMVLLSNAGYAKKIVSFVRTKNGMRNAHTVLDFLLP